MAVPTATVTALLLLLLPPPHIHALPWGEDPTAPLRTTSIDPPMELQVARRDKPAAHVVASSSQPGSLVWDDRVAPSLVRNGVVLRRNKLVVPRDGLYFVYAAAAFQGGGRCFIPPLRLSVSRFSEEYPKDVPLLTAVRSVCPGEGGRGGRRRRKRRGGGGGGDGGGGGPWFESLYQGAVFLLRGGDELEATTSTAQYLDLHGGGSAYFGVVGVD
ncbi:LOW QUALITY PROTEIN: tumor necrosis factor [Gallus gallus]|uniref:LOW QUALITY PROTEIN: tumor necrosis factor n=1 Tax=Gallus gallus TaxID=9031 RepID=UPI001AE7E301|nr:LOW QUALITY PROTEIN: tumor necrosis factor [Gallus gallus]